MEVVSEDPSNLGVDCMSGSGESKKDFNEEAKEEVKEEVKPRKCSPATIAIIILAVLLALTTAATIVLLVQRVNLSRSETSMAELMEGAVTSPDCNGILYHLNITTEQGPLALNVTQVPECFLKANPDFPPKASEETASTEETTEDAATSSQPHGRRLGWLKKIFRVLVRVWDAALRTYVILYR